MAIDAKILTTIVFDYGNTLVEFNNHQMNTLDEQLGEKLKKLFGSVDMEMLKEVRKEQRLTPYQGNPPEYLENKMADMIEQMIEKLYDREVSTQEISDIVKHRSDTFVDLVQVEDEVVDTLEALQRKYHLALLSNYPCGHTIRESLKKTGLTRFFEAVVVSGDIGHVKPHELPFQIIHEEMFIKPNQSVYVGDNWLADIQGAKTAGMQAIHVKQWDMAENFKQGPGDFRADETIEKLSELTEIL